LAIICGILIAGHMVQPISGKFYGRLAIMLRHEGAAISSVRGSNLIACLRGNGMATVNGVKRRKYRFKSRADAEDAFNCCDRERLQAEWFASAIVMGTTTQVGVASDGCRNNTVGYFTTRHSAFVYVLSEQTSYSPHCIRGIWDIDNVGHIVGALLRSEDTHDFGRMIDQARTLATRRLLS
jgi:hypothetical protein